MKTVALEIHDAGLVTADRPDFDPDAWPASPGYALVESKSVLKAAKVLTGQAALDRARLKPRFVHHRFWHDLDTASLPRPLPRDMSTADLAHAHLADFWRLLADGVESVVLALPSSFSERQLGLALGIARACEIPVHGMVDAAVAAASCYVAPKLLHLDVHLHRLVLTELRRSAKGGDTGVRPSVVRRSVEVADDAGLVALTDALARRVCELFVNATRFDPLHSAASEQELYGRLPGWLEELRASDSVEIVMRTPRGDLAVEMTRGDLASAARPFARRALDLIRARRGAEHAALLVTHRLAELPGVERRLDEMRGLDWTVLPPGASATGALRAHASIVAPGEEALPFVTRLPVDADAVSVETREPEPPRVSATSSDRVPTHFVKDGLAYRITHEPLLATAPWGNGHSAQAAPRCKIQLQDDAVVAVVPGDPDGQRLGVFLNGREVLGRVTLAAGDRLRLGAADQRPLELQLIAVVD